MTNKESPFYIPGDKPETLRQQMNYLDRDVERQRKPMVVDGEILLREAVPRITAEVGEGEVRLRVAFSENRQQVSFLTVREARRLAAFLIEHVGVDDGET